MFPDFKFDPRDDVKTLTHERSKYVRIATALVQTVQSGVVKVPLPTSVTARDAIRARLGEGLRQHMRKQGFKLYTRTFDGYLCMWVKRYDEVA